MPTSPARAPFEPDGASLAASPLRASAPALSSSNALARFEFESGRANDGTKILMVEWTSPSPASASDTWEVSWDGKSTVVPSSDASSSSSSSSPHRLYFLLPPHRPVPRLVRIAQHTPAGPAATMQTNPLPAIFPPALGASARAAGRRGVLHTRWARRRVAALEAEIAAEQARNGEGVALAMAVQECAWICENFGVGSREAGPGAGLRVDAGDGVATGSPRTPGGGRLAEKLRGLKVGTSEGALAARAAPPLPHTHNPLSPDQSDVAIGAGSAFALFHCGPAPAAPAVAHQPPRHVVAQQQQQGMGSLDAVATREEEADDDADEELFAVTLSPRSAGMAKSPFSLVAAEVVPWR